MVRHLIDIYTTKLKVIKEAIVVLEKLITAAQEQNNNTAFNILCEALGEEKTNKEQTENTIFILEKYLA